MPPPASPFRFYTGRNPVSIVTWASAAVDTRAVVHPRSGGCFCSGVSRRLQPCLTLPAVHRPRRPLPPRGPVVPAGSGSNSVRLTRTDFGLRDRRIQSLPYDLEAGMRAIPTQVWFYVIKQRHVVRRVASVRNRRARSRSSEERGSILASATFTFHSRAISLGWVEELVQNNNLLLWSPAEDR